MDGPRLLLLSLLLLLAFALTLPFGGWRVRCRRYSAAWFLSIHLPVPFLFLLRSAGGFSWRLIPLFLAATVLGHFAGGRLWRKATAPP